MDGWINVEMGVVGKNGGTIFDRVPCLPTITVIVHF